MIVADRIEILSARDIPKPRIMQAHATAAVEYDVRKRHVAVNDFLRMDIADRLQQQQQNFRNIRLAKCDFARDDIAQRIPRYVGMRAVYPAVFGAVEIDDRNRPPRQLRIAFEQIAQMRNAFRVEQKRIGIDAQPIRVAALGRAVNRAQSVAAYLLLEIVAANGFPRFVSSRRKRFQLHPVVWAKTHRIIKYRQTA